AVTRERRLAPGESLVFRPGDRLTVDAGSLMQFERGKRVPDAAVSGVTWANPAERRGLVSALRDVGLVLALAGAALALVPPVRPAALSGALPAATPLLLAIAAVASGVYAM